MMCVHGLDLPHDDKADGKAAEGALRVIHNGRDRRNDENAVAKNRSKDTHLDSLESSKIGIGNVATEQRHEVSPELVESL